MQRFLSPRNPHGIQRAASITWSSHCASISPAFSLPTSRRTMTALQRSKCGVAMLTRIAFLEGIGRHARLFSMTPPTDILQFTERVVMHHGKLSRTGSTATAYCWLVWRKNVHGAPYTRSTAFHWLAPCRKRLECDSDYPPEATE